MKERKPILFAFAIILITFNLWISSKTSLQDLITYPLKSVTQISALLGTVFLSVELILVSRARWLEQVIGPLDKLFSYHKNLSIFSVIAIVIHAMTLVTDAIPNTELVRLYVIPSISNVTYAAGIVALYLFVTTVSISLYVQLPYHIWKITHRVLGLSTLLATYHVFTVQSDISRSLPLRIWIVGLLFSGVFSLIYKVFLYAKLNNRYKYIITFVRDQSEIVTIAMRPVGKKIIQENGQFAYFQFINPQISTEEHPFSILSSQDDEEIVIAVKKIGDYTKTLGNLTIGDQVVIRGAYGGFGQDLGKYKKEIWIGAGIGITPFLSLQTPVQTSLYYITHTDQDAHFVDAIFQKTLKSENKIRFIHYQSKDKGRFKPELLLLNEKEIESCCVRICGPKGLLQSFKRAYEQFGLPLKQLVYEDFNFLDS